MTEPQTTEPKATGMEDFRPLVESALEKAIEEACSQDGCPDRLGNAIRYAVMAPGKRLRPGLVLMAAEACGGSIEEAMPGAVAVEMVHAYSLIHDDLPAMDDDDLRRGRPTVHIAFDQATAILAGDALQPMAFAHVSHHVSNSVKLAEVVRALAEAAGPAHLVGGQADDLAAEQDSEEESSVIVESMPRIAGQSQLVEQDLFESRTLRKLESIHRRKTGALFSASLDIGAILASAVPESRAVLKQYAADLGLAFQVVDDLLDYTSDAETLGKRAGKDANRGKLTYPSLLGIEGARRKAEQLLESAKKHALFFGDSGLRLTKLADYVLERTS